ncbi:MAG TPA: hypothetical protein VEB66_10375 [Opitutaceae bacterium]|nr:hypothetical protein [Opitutaceae bacterium]
MSASVAGPAARAEATTVSPAEFPQLLMTAAARPASDPERPDVVLQLLRRWSASDAAAAAGWALDQEAVPLDLALAALFDGLAARPPEAVALARALAGLYPELAPDLGSHVVAALGRAGAHEAAAGFAAAQDEPAAAGWTTTAYFEWGRADPHRALPALDGVANADRRHAAFQALVSGWAKTDPQGLLDAYPGFPPGWDQRFAVVTGLRALIQRDPDAAAAWIQRARLPFDPDWDLVLAD